MNRTVIVMGITFVMILSILAGILLFRMLLFKPVLQKTSGQPIKVSGNYDKQIKRFSDGLRFRTISSHNYAEMDTAQFKKFATFLQEAYPTLQLNMERSTVNEYGLVYRWKGKNQGLKPLLFLSHYDVVPVGDKEDETKWTYPPFSGTVVNDTIYGRGALDMKNILFAMLDASERLIEKNFIPERDIFFAFGFDKEVGGKEGAVQIANYFKDNCFTFDAVYDEGGLLSTTGISGISNNVALIGVAEKGKSSIRIRAHGPGGHASMPPLKNPLATVANVISSLENKQMQPMLTDPIYNLLCNISGQSGFINRFVLANRYLFESVILGQMLKNPATAAMVRTTTATTMARGSKAPNVLPATAEAIINFRILPGNTVEDVQRHIADICCRYDVDIDDIDSADPSPVSSLNTKGYERLTETIRTVYPNAIISPYLTPGATDSRKYYIVSPNVYRFMPVQVTENEQQSIHNVNERISTDNYKRMIYFYEQLISGYDK